MKPPSMTKVEIFRDEETKKSITSITINGIDERSDNYQLGMIEAKVLLTSSEESDRMNDQPIIEEHKLHCNDPDRVKVDDDPYLNIYDFYYTGRRKELNQMAADEGRKSIRDSKMFLDFGGSAPRFTGGRDSPTTSVRSHRGRKSSTMKRERAANSAMRSGQKVHELYSGQI